MASTKEIKKVAPEDNSDLPTDAKLPMCGVVMPISSIDGCSESHWVEVLSILTDSVQLAGFSANLVSNADDVGIIQKRIIQNLYDNPIVVCDVSCKNANVMFELGIRLAFDKPTIIIKDDVTKYSFDTAPIEHLEYPRDLRFTKIVEFKAKLSEKIKATHQRATSDKDYTTFLKHFGEFKIAKLEEKEVSGQEFILDELRSIRGGLRSLERAQIQGSVHGIRLRSKNAAEYEVYLGNKSQEEVDVFLKGLKDFPFPVRFERTSRGFFLISIGDNSASAKEYFLTFLASHQIVDFRVSD